MYSIKNIQIWTLERWLSHSNACMSARGQFISPKPRRKCTESGQRKKEDGTETGRSPKFREILGLKNLTWSDW